jgi:hypothetical protein
MECYICDRMGGTKLPLKCATCARSAIYPLRLQQASTLLEKEAMGRKVEAVVEGRDQSGTDERLAFSGAMIDMHDCAKAHELETLTADATRLEERIQLISSLSQKLKSDMEEHKKSMAAKKAGLSRRRSDYESATHALEAREAKDLETLQAGIKRMNRRRDLKQQDIVAGRFSLCREAAILAGLKRRTRKRSDGSMKDSFTIGDGLPIFDLRELHSESLYRLDFRQLLTSPRCQPRSPDCHPYPTGLPHFTSVNLPGSSASRRDHTPTPWLLTGHHIFSSVIVSFLRGSLSRHRLITIFHQ